MTILRTISFKDEYKIELDMRTFRTFYDKDEVENLIDKIQDEIQEEVEAEAAERLTKLIDDEVRYLDEIDEDDVECDCEDKENNAYVEGYEEGEEDANLSMAPSPGLMGKMAAEDLKKIGTRLSPAQIEWLVKTYCPQAGEFYHLAEEPPKRG